MKAFDVLPRKESRASQTYSVQFRLNCIDANHLVSIFRPLESIMRADLPVDRIVNWLGNFK